MSAPVSHIPRPACGTDRAAIRVRGRRLEDGTAVGGKENGPGGPLSVSHDPLDQNFMFWAQ